VSTFKGDEKMKNSYIILAVAVILVFTTMGITSSAAQGLTPKLSTHRTDQNWPSMSGLIIAYHDMQMEPGPWEDLDIHEISFFIDESIENGTLLGQGSGSEADERLNILKNKIDVATYVLENGTFEEACNELYDAYLSTDGLSQPPDLVYGQSTPELAKKIKLMIVEIIGCE
jgi:hypothetical protein